MNRALDTFVPVSSRNGNGFHHIGLIVFQLPRRIDEATWSMALEWAR